MFDQDHSSDELKALAQAFAALSPAPSGIQSDRLFYLAGQAAAAKANQRAWRLWPCIAAAALVACAGLTSALALRPVRIDQRIVYVQAEPEKSPEKRTDAERSFVEDAGPPEPAVGTRSRRYHGFNQVGLFPEFQKGYLGMRGRALAGWDDSSMTDMATGPSVKSDNLQQSDFGSSLDLRPFGSHLREKTL